MTVELAELGRATRSKVTISLGMVQFRVNMHGSVADQSDPVVNVCTNGHDATRVRQATKCPECGNDDSDTWQKAQEDGDALTVLDKDAVDKIKANDATFRKEINLSVVDADTTFLVPSGNSYFLAPVGGSGNANYLLFAELIKKNPKSAFIGEFSFLGAPKLFRLVVDNGVLVLREMARPEAIRQRPQVPAGRVDSKMLAMGMQLVDTLREPFDPERWVNAHARDVADLIANTPATTGTAPGTAARGGDLLAQLEASIAAATASKTPAPAPRKRTTKKLAVVKPAA